MPKRIQLKRTKGYRTPPNTVIVDRRTPYGNRHRVNRICEACGTKHIDVKECIDAYRDELESAVKFWGFALKQHPEMIARKDVACWCKLCDDHADGLPLGTKCERCAPCHGDVLLELANKGVE